MSNNKLDWRKLSAEQTHALFELEQLIQGSMRLGRDAVEKCDQMRRDGIDVSSVTPIEIRVLTQFGALHTSNAMF